MLNPFGGLITSRTCVQILMRLFLNPLRRAYLRELADEFGASPNQVKEELAQLSAAGLLQSEKSGRQVLYRANTAHALYPELNSMVCKVLGMDRIVESVIERLGQLEQAWLIDGYAQGRDSGIIDQTNLTDVITKTEHHLGRRMRVLVLGSECSSGCLASGRICCCRAEHPRHEYPPTHGLCSHYCGSDFSPTKPQLTGPSNLVSCTG